MNPWIISLSLTIAFVIDILHNSADTFGFVDEYSLNGTSVMNFDKDTFRDVIIPATASLGLL